MMISTWRPSYEERNARVGSKRRASKRRKLVEFSLGLYFIF